MTTAEIRAEMARIETNRRKGGAFLRSAHAMEARLTKKVRVIFEEAFPELAARYRWTTLEWMVDRLEEAGR